MKKQGGNSPFLRLMRRNGQRLGFVLSAKLDRKGALLLLIRDNGRTYCRRFDPKAGAVVNLYNPLYSCLFISTGLKPTAPRNSAGWRLGRFRGVQAVEANEPEAQFIAWTLMGKPLNLKDLPWQHLPQEEVQPFPVLAEVA